MMTLPSKPTVDEMRSFAHRYGLDKLSEAHIERLAELAVYVSDLGANLPRPREKHVAPYTKARSGDN